MLRAILSVLVGYLVIFLCVFVLMSGAFLALGQDFAYRPGTYDVSVGWGALSLGIGLIAAIVGGAVAAGIARTATPVRVLAALVLVLGLLYAAPKMLNPPEPVARTGDVSILEGMRQSREPAWALLGNVIVGCVGVLIGERLRKSFLAQPAPPAPPIG